MDKLKMIYKTDSGKNTSITLNGVRSGITDNDAKALVDAFVASGVVRTQIGKVTEKVSCALCKAAVFPFAVI